MKNPLNYLRLKYFAAFAIASYTIAPKVQASQTFLFSFDKVFTGGRIEEARLIITTADTASTANGFTGYLIESVGGTDEGNPVTALMPDFFSDPLLTGLPTDNLFNPLTGTPAPGNQFSLNGFAYAAGDELYQFYYGPFNVTAASDPSDYQGFPCSKYPNVYKCRPDVPAVERPKIINVKTSTPVPAPLPLVGIGAAFCYSRNLRRRVNTSKFPNVIRAIG